MKIESLKAILIGERNSLIKFSQMKGSKQEFMQTTIDSEIAMINHVLDLINLDLEEELRDD